MRQLLVELVGGVRARARDGRPVRLSSRKCQALLGCLALKPGAVLSRDFLAALLWEDSDPELARASLRQALTTLRRALPEELANAVRADAGSVWLDAESVSSDVADFHALVQDGSPGALLASITRVDGVLFAGVDARSAAFEQWAEEQRRLFHRQQVEAMERMAAQCNVSGDLPGQLAALERLVGIEPVNERAQRELMAVLARLGRHTDALRQYRICRDALRRELDVATEPATDALQRDILRRRRAQPASPDADEDQAEATGAHESLPMAPTLREAVVLCVRVAGGSTPEDDADPERTRERWTAVAALVRAVVERFGGAADDASQGEVLAVFGSGSLTGNEADRAARAAWELVAVATRPAADAFTLACGISDGQVLPAAAATLFPLTGRPVNVARQLARAAESGSILVPSEFAARLGASIRIDGAMEDQSLNARRIVSVVGRTAVDPLRRFVGRRAELALLTTLLERVTESGRARTVVIRGEPGIGKSSLVDTLTRSAQEQGVATHALQTLDFGQSPIERPIPALALRLLGTESDASSETRAAAVGHAVDRGLVTSDERLLLSELVGVPISADGSSRLAAMDRRTREQGRAAVLHRLLQREATGPVLLVVEDVHWADAAEIAQLADLAAAIATHPVLVVLTTRSDDGALSAAWRGRGRGCPMTTLDLAPLADDEARELAVSHADLPAEVVERCLETAMGHPLFLEQLLRAARAGQTALPGSVRGLVVARVERLESGLQRALHAAAILGIRFTREAWRHLLADPQHECHALEQAGLIIPDGEECRFAHALIRDAVYESLLGSTRRDLHQRAATWYQQRDAGLHAEHLAAAADPRAAVAYLRAAVESQGAYRLDRALTYAERALEVAREPPDTCDAHATVGDVQLAMGRTSEACAAYRASIDLAISSAARARAWLGLAKALRIVDRYDEALVALDRAEQEMEATDSKRLAQLWTLRGNLHFPRGALDLCLGAHERALAFANQAGSVEDIARARGGLGDAQYQRGRIRSAHAEFRRCVDLSEQHGLTGLQLAYLPMVAAAQVYTCEFTAALANCDRAASAAREISDRRAELLALSIRASIENNCAHYQSARVASEQSLELSRALGARRFEAEGLVLLGLARLGLGERELAREALELAAGMARESCPTYCGPWAFAALALTIDDADRIRDLLAEGERLLALGCVSHNYLEFYHCAIEVCLCSSEPERAQGYAASLEAYTSAEPLPWADVVIARGRVLASARSPGVADEIALRDVLQVASNLQFNALVPALEEALQDVA